MSRRKQKALFLQAKEGDLYVGEAKVPQPGPGEILIKVIAAGLNPSDWTNKEYAYFIPSYPTVIGTDLAGDVVEVGEDVDEFKKGDSFFQGQFGNRTTGFQQYTIGLAVTTARIPDGFSYDDVAALPVVLTAAYAGLCNPNPDGLGFTPPKSTTNEVKCIGEPIVILGSATSVGQLVIQLARIMGFSPIITTPSLSNAAELEELSATHVLDRNISTEEIIAQLHTLLGNLELKTVYESVSSVGTQKLAMDIIVPGGQILIVYLATEKPTNDKRNLYHDLISDWVSRGAIKPDRVEVLHDGLEGIPEGLRRLEADELSRGKFIARPQETV